MRTDKEQRLNRLEPSMACWAIALACLGWTALWYFTPGLHGNGIGSRYRDDAGTDILIETATAVVLLLIIVPLHKRYNRELFAPSKQLPLYALPVVLAVALPFHYTLPLPLPVYMMWMTVSVFWQDYLTFGLLQNYLRERLPTWAVIGGVTSVFYLGHALFIPDRFAPTQPLAALGIIALGIVLSALRTRLKTLHVLLALHLSFYFLLA